MTLLQFVKYECANWKNGTCLFGSCLVAAGERCGVSRAVLTGGSPRTPGLDYFRACVAPLAQTRPEYADAADEYARICGAKAQTRRSCECGAVVAKRVVVCARCKAARRKRRRLANRASVVASVTI